MSAPEFDGAPMTRREVLIAREAYMAAGMAYSGEPGLTLHRDAAEAYPLPSVTRPRVVAVEDQPGLRMRVRDGVLQYSREDGFWSAVNPHQGPRLSTGLLTALRSLDAEPTETVTEEEG